MVKLTVSICCHDYGNPDLSKSFFHRAVKSVLRYQHPDEILLLTDTSWDVAQECFQYPNTNFKIVPQQRVVESEAKNRNIYKSYSSKQISKFWGHTRDLAINSVLKAENEWVRLLDLDDEMRTDVRPYIEKAGSEIGAICGVAIQQSANSDQIRTTYGSSDRGTGSANVFRKKAVVEVAKYWEPGPWPDTLLLYIMKRLGWKILEIIDIFSLTHKGNWNTRKIHKEIDIEWEKVREKTDEYLDKMLYEVKYISCPMCAWDAADTIELALESTKDVCSEYLLVNHESSDNTLDIVKDCEVKWGLNIRYFFCPRDMPFWEVRRFSFERARGDWILVTDADHVFHTTGKYNIKFWIQEHTKMPRCVWRLPLINLRYTLNKVPAKNVLTPPHKLFYYNFHQWQWYPNVTRWGRILDLPFPHWTIPNVKNVVDEEYRGIFNVTQQSPMKALRRTYWHIWGRRPFSCSMNLDNFIRKILEKDDIEEFAKQWFKKRKEQAETYKGEYGSLPKVIQKRL